MKCAAARVATLTHRIGRPIGLPAPTIAEAEKANVLPGARTMEPARGLRYHRPESSQRTKTKGGAL
jgi:hypothetical protein